MIKITSYCWLLWATTERNSGVTKTGFYSVQPFAQQYRSTDIWEDARSDPPSDEEIMVASEIAVAVMRLRSVEPPQAQALTLFHGAYPDAPLRRKDRLKEMDGPKRRFYADKDKAEIYVQAWIDCTQQTP